MTSRPKITVAIDLGSTFCGYAICIDDQDIKTNPEWVPDSGRAHIKTPTALLYDENLILNHYGFEATSNITKRGNNFFRFFKKSADDAKVFNLTNVFRNQSGVEKCSLDLYADMLRLLKEHCLDFLEKAELGEKPDVHEILWILPVPIIWPVHERNFVIGAAMQAGLITEMKATNIMIILEGDATFAFCQELDPYKDMERRLNQLKMKRVAECEGVLVIDAGGKTVDATTKWKSTSGSYSEVESEKLHPTGFSSGGESINREFETRLAEIVGSDFIKHLKENELDLWLKFMAEFEIKKKNFNKDKQHILMSDACVSNIEKSYNAWSTSKSLSKPLEQVFEKDENGLVLDGGHLRLPQKFVLSLFDETVSSITTFIDSELNRSTSLSGDGKRIEVIYLAGGFASCEYLQQKVAETVGDRAVVVIPKHPEQGVLRGAIHYSRSHQCVSTAKVDSNYGVQTRVWQQMDDRTYYPHLLSKGSMVLKGNTYYVKVHRDELVDSNSVHIYRDEDVFLSFTLTDIPNIINQDLRPWVKIYLQMSPSTNDTRILQATLIDGITQECFIKRKQIPRKYEEVLQKYEMKELWDKHRIVILGVFGVICLLMFCVSPPFVFGIAAGIGLFFAYLRFIREEM